jgi:hypothetical protein
MIFFICKNITQLVRDIAGNSNYNFFDKVIKLILEKNWFWFGDKSVSLLISKFYYQFIIIRLYDPTRIHTPFTHVLKFDFL